MNQLSFKIAPPILSFYLIAAFPVWNEQSSDLCNSSFPCNMPCDIILNVYSEPCDQQFQRHCLKVNHSCIIGCNSSELINCQTCLNDAPDATCDGKCSGICTDANCTHLEHLGMECSECLPGFFGPACTRACSKHCQGSCHSKNGYCRRCELGRYGRACEQKCPQHCYDKKCSTNDGTCMGCENGHLGSTCSEVCRTGYYGKDCHNRCGRTCAQNRCDPVTGKCHNGCVPGYYGLTCENVCPNGTYGPGCLSQCPVTCAQSSDCHHVTGNCPEGCVSGFKGDDCSAMCAQGVYGKNCDSNCSNTCYLQICSPFSGHCKRCVQGWRGLFCEDSMTIHLAGKSDIDAVITTNQTILMFSGLFIMGIVVWFLLAILMYYRRRKLLQKIAETGKIPRSWIPTLYQYRSLSGLSKLRVTKTPLERPKFGSRRYRRPQKDKTAFPKTFKVPRTTKNAEAPATAFANKVTLADIQGPLSPSGKTSGTANAVRVERIEMVEADVGKRSRPDQRAQKLTDLGKSETNKTESVKDTTYDITTSGEEYKTMPSFIETVEESQLATVAEGVTSLISTSGDTKKNLPTSGTSTQLASKKDSYVPRAQLQSSSSKSKHRSLNLIKILGYTVTSLKRSLKSKNTPPAAFDVKTTEAELESEVKPSASITQQAAAPIPAHYDTDNDKCICSIQARQGSATTSNTLQTLPAGGFIKYDLINTSVDEESSKSEQLKIDTHFSKDTGKQQKVQVQRATDDQEVKRNVMPRLKLRRATTQVKSLETSPDIHKRTKRNTQDHSAPKHSPKKPTGHSVIKNKVEDRSSNDITDSETTLDTESSRSDFTTGSSSYSDQKDETDEPSLSKSEETTFADRRKRMESADYKRQVRELLDAQREQHLIAALIRQSQPSEARAPSLHIWNPQAKTCGQKRSFLSRGYTRVASAFSRMGTGKQPPPKPVNRHLLQSQLPQKRHASSQFLLARLETWRRSSGFQHNINDGVFEIAASKSPLSPSLSYTESNDYTSSQPSEKIPSESAKTSLSSEADYLSDYEHSYSSGSPTSGTTPSSVRGHRTSIKQRKPGRYHKAKQAGDKGHSVSNLSSARSMAITSDGKSTPPLGRKRKTLADLRAQPPSTGHNLKDKHTNVKASSSPPIKQVKRGQYLLDRMPGEHGSPGLTSKRRSVFTLTKEQYKARRGSQMDPVRTGLSHSSKEFSFEAGTGESMVQSGSSPTNISFESIDRIMNSMAPHRMKTHKKRRRLTVTQDRHKKSFPATPGTGTTDSSE